MAMDNLDKNKFRPVLQTKLIMRHLRNAFRRTSKRNAGGAKHGAAELTCQCLPFLKALRDALQFGKAQAKSN